MTEIRSHDKTNNGHTDSCCLIPADHWLLDNCKITFMKYICAIIAVLFIVLTMLGCNTEKHVSSSVEKVDSTYTKELEKKIAELEITNAHFKNVISELESIGVTYYDRCDTAALRRIFQGTGCPDYKIDSFINAINQQQNEIEMLADGSTKFKGAIKAYAKTTQRLEETIIDLKKTLARSEQEKETIKAELEATRKLKNKVVVKEVFPGFAYWLLILALIGGGAAGWRLKMMADKMYLTNKK